MGKHKRYVGKILSRSKNPVDKHPINGELWELRVRTDGGKEMNLLSSLNAKFASLEIVDFLIRNGSSVPFEHRVFKSGEYLNFSKGE